MNGKGFTLADTTICCLIIAGLAAAGLSGLTGLGAHQDLQAACEGLVSDFYRARMTAITGNVPVTVVIRADRRAYALGEPGDNALHWRELPRGIIFEACPKTSLVFYSRGSAVPAGTYTLLNSSGRVQVIVAGSGRARWKRV